CTGCELVADRPSMVTMRSVGLTSATRSEHERTTTSSMCTEQAPHWATPHPYLVPVRPTCSRITHKSGVCGSTSTSRTGPLILSFAIGSSLPCCLSRQSLLLIGVLALGASREAARPRRAYSFGGPLTKRP